MGKKIKRYAILTPFDQAEVVAGIAALQKLDVDVVPTKSGVLVVRELPVPQYDEWDIRNILGPDDSDFEELGQGNPSDNAPAVAAFFSRLSKFGVVLVDVDLGEDTGFEAGVSGVVRARRYLGGEAGEEVPAGLLLNALDPVVERIVLGQASPEEHDAVKSKDVKPADIVRRGRKSRWSWGRTDSGAENADSGAEDADSGVDDGDGGADSPRDSAE